MDTLTGCDAVWGGSRVSNLPTERNLSDAALLVVNIAMKFNLAIQTPFSRHLTKPSRLPLADV